MLAIVLALASAIGYGGSDFAAGLASRSASVIQVTLLASAASVVVVAAALPLAAGHPPTAAALAWGAVAGFSGTVGAFALYIGFRHAAFSVAGPLSAVGAAGFSVLAGLLLGERPSTLAMAGIILALPAIVGVSASAASASQSPVAGAEARDTVEAGAQGTVGAGAPGTVEAGAQGTAGAGAPGTVEAGAQPTVGAGAPGTVGAAADPGTAGALGAVGVSARSASGRPAAGVAAGLVAGACFALLFIGLNRAGSGSGLWPVAAAQVAELAVACGVAAVTGNIRLPGQGTGRLAVITGATGAVGTILYFFATHDGFLSVTAVLTSLYPAITIVLARVLLGERLTALRVAGLSLAAACVALIAVGGAG